MNATQRNEVLTRYRAHVTRFEAAAASRHAGRAAPYPVFDGLDGPERPLTPRELDVLQLVADGLGNREIGTRLFVSEETVKSHLRAILAKLNVTSRAHAVSAGFRGGYLA